MSQEASRLHGLRGAITVERNDADEILQATSELMKALMERNALAPEDVVSCIFTATNDLDAQFPAVAARALGFEHVPLLCAREIPVPGSLPMVIRVLIHYYPSDGAAPSHAYLRGASALRTDLQAAQ
jgi:chorismate mutase